jgi:N-methylhydantoinase A
MIAAGAFAWLGPHVQTEGSAVGPPVSSIGAIARLRWWRDALEPSQDRVVGIRVGIDTGGTFTDLVGVDESSGAWYMAKVPSTPEDPVLALAAALAEAGIDGGEVSHIVVGTTIGINAVLTRTGARVIYLTTLGFEDVPHIQRINRKYHYDFTWRKPEALVRRRDCIGIDERVDAQGRVVQPLDPAMLQAALPDRDADDVAVAVCFLFSYLNPACELVARDAIAAVDPRLSVSLSHEVAPIWREYERGTAAILDAYLKPQLDRYVSGVGDAFAGRGVRSPWSLLKSNGGHVLADEARARPSHVLLSGVAGGAIGGAHYARARGVGQAIALDMGGTSCDVCLIVDGAPLFSSEFEIEFGLPVAVPTVSAKTIGAGGGSIGWVDPGGLLQVGPQSAGADPGPACYARGGAEPTLTDANLVLGRLNPDYFLGGALALDAARARGALERLGADVVEVARSMVRIANENMANAIRIVTVEQGVDPREHALIAMGGAGPTHAAEIAEAIGITRVIVPLHPGLTSALGALAAPVRVDEVRSVRMDSTVPAARLAAEFDALERAALGKFAVQGGFGAPPSVRRTISMRYEGQNYEEEMELDAGSIGESALAQVLARYHARHEAFYGYRLPGLTVEFVHLAVSATAAADRSLPAPAASGQAAAPAERITDVHFAAGGSCATAAVPRAGLLAGGERAGPLVIEAADTTVVVPPGWFVSADAAGILELRDGGAAG